MAQTQSEFFAIINQFVDAIVSRVHQNLGATSSNEACGSTSIEPCMLAIVSKIFFHICCVYSWNRTGDTSQDERLNFYCFCVCSEPACLLFVHLCMRVSASKITTRVGYFWN